MLGTIILYNEFELFEICERIKLIAKEAEQHM